MRRGKRDVQLEVMVSAAVTVLVTVLLLAAAHMATEPQNIDRFLAGRKHLIRALSEIQETGVLIQ